MEADLRTLTNHEIDSVSGGFACGGLCVAGAITAGLAVGGGGAYLALR